MTPKSDDKKKVRHTYFIVFLSGILVWILDATIAFYFFNLGENFWDLMILKIPPYNLFMRLLIVALFHILGYKIIRQIRTYDRTFNNIFQTIPDSLFLFSKDGTALEFNGNKKNSQFYQRSVLGKKLSEIFPKRISDTITANIEAILKFKKPLIFNYNAEDEENKRKYYEVRSLYYSEEKFAVLIRDISEQKEYEKKLEESSKKYSNLVDNLTDIVGVIDKKGKIIYGNSQMYTSLGYKPEELKGQNFFALYLDPKAIYSLTRKIKGVPGVVLSFDCELKHKSGHYIPFSGKVVGIEWGKEIEYIGILRDETEKKKSENLSKEFNKKMEESLKKYTNLVNNLTDIIGAVDPKGKINYCNPQVYTLLGYKPEELLGQKFFKLLANPKALLSVGKKIIGVPGVVLSYDCQLKHKSGHYIPFSGKVVGIESGDQIEYIGILRDETEKKKSEDMMRKFNVKLEKEVDLKTLELQQEIRERKIIENKLRTSENKQKDQINQLNCLFGISHLLSTPDISIRETLQNVLNLIPPTFKFPNLINVKITFNGIEYKLNNILDTTWKISRKEFVNDKILLIEIFYQDNLPFLKEEENLIKKIGELLKIGLLRREIENEKENLLKMVENSDDAFINMDLDGTMIYWNKGAEQTFGYTAKEVLYRKNLDLVPPDRYEERKFIFDRIKKGEKVKHFETKRLRKDGKELDISVTYSPFINYEDKIIGVFSIARDFTEKFEQQKKFQDHIIKASEFKSEFMSSMSHELRTPLNSIIGFSDILKEKFYGDLNEKQENYIENVRSSAQHLLELINDILDISKIEAGKITLRFVDVNLKELLNQIGTTIRPEYEKKNLTFEIIGLEEGKMIKCDPKRFKEIIFNLLSNAIKYTISGGITLEIFETRNHWEFSVIDTGIGIEEKDFKFIFQDFKRLKNEHTATVEGTGLGLSLTKRLIELHNGNISFKSKWKEGSTFTITLPKFSQTMGIENY
ncbi:PAS domain S-box protein [Promethearchaeum syntrophicum]|uniref:histidine kinase n=1 Tax=Promethearchaeum syntrophicum TaxID=2594042 RepID=A0A5B9DBR6_9ARCH|nr:PAS domain S-box protein [Candidatus Prometheoarchaeum syntrophicum]QEE16628.1 aerobic respiration control sensor protein ArcB [Candidatus Prometheoarchaeum syntrophicum]